MKKDYRSKMYEVSFMPQWKLAGRERGYHEIKSEGGNYRCFQYHFGKRNELLDAIFACELGKGKYAGYSPEERKTESAVLREKEEAHNLKAKIFANMCGLILC